MNITVNNMLKNADNLEKLISERRIEYYEYSDFKNLRLIGKGAFGNVFRANWKDSTRYFALKSFNNDKQTLKKIVEEVQYF
jgi:serine/threonine protein kinase